MTPKELDYLKWKIDLAKGFNIFIVDRLETVKFRRGDYVFSFRLENIEESLIYPHLIQCAIEGFNCNVPVNYIIENRQHGIFITEATIIIERFMFDGIPTESAKESALQYIYEHEVKS